MNVLQAKFPYFYIDEFQDTNPIQVELLKLIGGRETIVGVIGDDAQSIYSFQGADPNQFHSFELPNIVDYNILDNRRSTNQIIDVLNKVRSNISQNKIRNVNSEKPLIIIGNKADALALAIDKCNNESVYSLSRDNITSNMMKKEIREDFADNKLLYKLLEVDKSSSSNHYRSKTVKRCLKAVELAHEGKFKDSIKELCQLFNYVDDKNEAKKEALKSLCLLIKEYKARSRNKLFIVFFWEFPNPKSVFFS